MVRSLAAANCSQQPSDQAVKLSVGSKGNEWMSADLLIIFLVSTHLSVDSPRKYFVSFQQMMSILKWSIEFVVETNDQLLNLTKGAAIFTFVAQSHSCLVFRFVVVFNSMQIFFLRQ